MGRPKKKKTILMRVPDEFNQRVGILSKKYGYSTKTEFLEKDVNRILDNADFINENLLFKFFKRKKTK